MSHIIYLGSNPSFSNLNRQLSLNINRLIYSFFKELTCLINLLDKLINLSRIFKSSIVLLN